MQSVMTITPLTVSQKYVQGSRSVPSLDKGSDKVTEILALVLGDPELNGRRLSASVGVSDAACTVWCA